MACAYYAYYLKLVKIGITLVIQYQWSILALKHTLGVVVVEHGDGANLVLLHIFHFHFGPFHRIAPVLERSDESGCAAFDDVAYLVAVVVQILCTSCRLVKFQGLLEVEVCEACERHRIKYFLMHRLFLSFKIFVTKATAQTVLLVAIFLFQLD